MCKLYDSFINRQIIPSRKFNIINLATGRVQIKPLEINSKNTFLAFWTYLLNSLIFIFENLISQQSIESLVIPIIVFNFCYLLWIQRVFKYKS